MKPSRLFASVSKKVHFFFVVFVVFFVYITFFAEHNYMKIVKYDREIKELNREIKATRDSFHVYRKKLDELNTNPEMLEKIVREEYHMKRDNEDVYIVKEK